MIDGKDIPEDFCLSSYHYSLPEEQIAQKATPKRNESRLLILERQKDKGNWNINKPEEIKRPDQDFSDASQAAISQSEISLTEDHFTNILDYLPNNSLLLVNNSRVIPARLMGKRSTGGKLEFLLLTPLPILKVENMEKSSALETVFKDKLSAGKWQKSKAQGLLKSSKQVKVGEYVYFTDKLCLKLLERHDFGLCDVELLWLGSLQEIIEEIGLLPLPPYIKRSSGELIPEDKIRYQTIYNNKDKAGSAAAPTAGLHFTKELKDKIIAAGHQWAEATLYVGYGTFSPIRCTDIRKHKMHAEYIELSEETAELINKARDEGRPIVAVGTTSLRLLEAVYLKLYPDEKNKQKKLTNSREIKTSKKLHPLKAYAGWVDIFIYPGADFYLVDALITNFHLPESSLLMLVSAFAGRKNILKTYEYAVKNSFRFFSYGDAMLIK